MAFPLKARHLEIGDRVNLGKYPAARELSPNNQWAHIYHLRLEDDAQIRAWFLFGGDPDLGFQVKLLPDKYLQVERNPK